MVQLKNFLFFSRKPHDKITATLANMRKETVEANVRSTDRLAKLIGKTIKEHHRLRDDDDAGEDKNADN